VKNLQDLFDSLDPSPFIALDLRRRTPTNTSSPAPGTPHPLPSRSSST
jgi:hypothetical protein